jgi:hypothetical protein
VGQNYAWAFCCCRTIRLLPKNSAVADEENENTVHENHLAVDKTEARMACTVAKIKLIFDHRSYLITSVGHLMGTSEMMKRRAHTICVCAEHASHLRLTTRRAATRREADRIGSLEQEV